MAILFLKSDLIYFIRRVWRYQRGNQKSVNRRRTNNTMAKEKVQKDKERSTKHTHKIKDRVTRTTLKTYTCRLSDNLFIALFIIFVLCLHADM